MQVRTYTHTCTCTVHNKQKTHMHACKRTCEVGEMTGEFMHSVFNNKQAIAAKNQTGEILCCLGGECKKMLTS